VPLHGIDPQLLNKTSRIPFVSDHRGLYKGKPFLHLGGAVEAVAPIEGDEPSRISTIRVFSERDSRQTQVVRSRVQAGLHSGANQNLCGSRALSTDWL
jgi:hypothetical protein